MKKRAINRFKRIEQEKYNNDLDMVIDENWQGSQTACRPRQAWDKHFFTMTKSGDDALLVSPIFSKWDEEEWIW